MIAPEWMQKLARANPTVNAYLRIWGESDRASFFETLAQELASQNDELIAAAIKREINRGPAPLVVIGGV